MTTGSILLGLSLFLLVGLFIARPFLLPQPEPPRLTTRQSLLAEKEALLGQIRLLDFDAETGKQLPEEYTAEREMLMQRATAVLAQLEETEDLEAAIEAAVAKLRGETGESAPVPKANINFCPECGTAVKPDNKFCTQCGTALTMSKEP